jgi:colanic acid biosynthesis glycosyl transferase WcaI
MMGDPLLVVTPTFAPEKIGTPHYVTDLVRALTEAGNDVTVVTNQPYYPAFKRFEGYGRSTRLQQIAGASVHRVPTIVPRGGAFMWRAISEANFVMQVLILRLRGTVRRQRQVLAVSPGVPFVVLAARLCRDPDGRLVAVVHDIQAGLISSSRVRRLAGIVEAWALNRADHVTVLSAVMRESLVELGVRKPIDVDPLWPTITAPDDVEPDHRVVLYSGNLGRKQGVHHLLTLAEHLERLAPSAEVVIRGDGSERERLVTTATEQHRGNVRFEGLVEAHELARSLASAAVHVIPQLPEGAAAAMPSKIFNILAVGRPVVAYASAESGMAELADQLEAVVRVEPGDDVGFARAVAEALALDHDELERIGQEAREYIAREFSRTSAARTLLVRLRDGSDDRGRFRR